jgi:hypothetical protein
VTVIADDLVHQAGIQNAHLGYPLEEQIHRSFSAGRRWWRYTRQPFLDRTLQRGFDIFTGQAGKALREFIHLRGTNIHGTTHHNLRAREYTIIEVRLTGPFEKLPREAFGLRPRMRQMYRARIAQFEIVALANMTGGA